MKYFTLDSEEEKLIEAFDANVVVPAPCIATLLKDDEAVIVPENVVVLSKNSARLYSYTRSLVTPVINILVPSVLNATPRGSVSSAVGVKVKFCVPNELVFIEAGLHEPLKPSLEMVGNSGVVCPLHRCFGKLKVGIGCVLLLLVKVVTQPLLFV